MRESREQRDRRSAGGVLWVTDEPPDRAFGGGGIRQAYLLEAAARVFPVELLVTGSLRDEHLRSLLRDVHELPKVTGPARKLGPVLGRLWLLAVALFWPGPTETLLNRRTRRVLARAIPAYAERVELVFVEPGGMAPLIPHSTSGRWVISFHHLLTVMADHESAKAGSRRQRWLWRMQKRKARRLEERAVRSSEAAVVCSEEDAAAVRSWVPDANAVVIPNGVNVNRFPVTPVPREPRLLLPGTLSWAPNVDGARWFCDEVFPLVLDRVPEATLTIVGRAPVPEVFALADRRGVELHQDVPSLVSFFQDARVVVVPLRVGTGTRLKALEALAAARPLVGTTIGLEGLGLVDGVTARIADDPRRMAEAIVDLLLDDDGAVRLAQAGRALAEKRYDWNAIGDRFVEFLRAHLVATANSR
ncbi:MAG: glycosyltransferase family 4 protein [Acidimicrobiales bacterium]